MEIIPQPSLFDGQDVCAIYGIFHIVTGRVYIGSAQSIKARWAVHVSCLKNGRHPNKPLQSACKQYGIYSFTFRILEVVKSKELLAEREQYWIDKFDACCSGKGFNIARIASNKLSPRAPERRSRKVIFRTDDFSQKLISDKKNTLPPRALSELEIAVIKACLADGQPRSIVANRMGLKTSFISRLIRNNIV